MAAEQHSRRLPSGPHGIPAEVVERNQRERLIAAMAEVCGEKGYAETSVAEVAKRAGVSTASFYRQFEDKRECMLISFEELFGRLLEAVEAGCDGNADPAARIRDGARTAAELLSQDPLTARLLSVEILAVGRDGVAAQHEAIARLAGLLRPSMAAARPVDAAWSRAAGLVALVARESATGKGPAPSDFEALSEVP
jgi:AcrR family transcriptional regulator